MKKISLFAVMVLLVMITSCKKEIGTSETEMTFETEKYDFGTIMQGDKVFYDFKFKNTGGSDLIITGAKGSCGCTVPEYPKEAIKPGVSGVIKVSFNSAGKSGKQAKSVTLFCNINEGKKVLHINSNIEVPEKD
jgi:hypothetical protein